MLQNACSVGQVIPSFCSDPEAENKLPCWPKLSFSSCIFVLLSKDALVPLTDFAKEDPDLKTMKQNEQLKIILSAFPATAFGCSL